MPPERGRRKHFARISYRRVIEISSIPTSEGHVFAEIRRLGPRQMSRVSPGSRGWYSPPPCSVAQARRAFERSLPARESTISWVGNAWRGATATT